MNMLSILLYTIYLLNSVNIFLAIGAVLMTILVGICLMGWMGNAGNVSSVYHGSHAQENCDWWAAKIKKYLKWPIILWAIFILIPNEQTVKLIAASEVAGYLATTEAGQQVINEVGKTAGKTGEIAQDSLNLLHEYIKKELGTLQDEVKEKVKEKVNKAIEETT